MSVADRRSRKRHGGFNRLRADSGNSQSDPTVDIVQPWLRYSMRSPIWEWQSPDAGPNDSPSNRSHEGGVIDAEVMDMLRTIALVVLLFSTTSCSSHGFLFFSNNVDQDINISYREEFITLAPSSHSERFRRSSNPIPMSVAVGDCKYDYDEKRFFDAVSARDLEKFDRRVRFVVEIAIHPNGEIRLYQFNPDTQARIFEILPAGYRITPINRDGEADC